MCAILLGQKSFPVCLGNWRLGGEAFRVIKVDDYKEFEKCVKHLL